MNEEQAKSVTVMKYLASDGAYQFIVKDKHNIPDPVKRLDHMIELKKQMLESGEMKKFLWLKETVLF